jgi:hypothetical protein
MSEKVENFNEEGILNIKANMKAGTGIVYKEDGHRENGPSYIDRFRKTPKYSLEEYNTLFGKNSTIMKNRAMSKMEELSKGSTVMNSPTPYDKHEKFNSS